jgi:hypothetical protein
MAKQPTTKKPATNKRKYSRPSIEKMLVVNSEGLITGVETYVNKTMSALYALDVILFYIEEGNIADMANDKAAEVFEDKITNFNKLIIKYKAMAEQVDAPEECNYKEQIAKTYKIYSPLCSIYLNLIQKAELITNMIDAIWLAGGMKSSVRNKRVRNLSTQMRNLSNQMINMSTNAMKLARNKGQDVEDSVNESIKEIIDSVNNDSKLSEDKRPNLSVLKELSAEQDGELEPDDELDNEATLEEEKA